MISQSNRSNRRIGFTDDTRRLLVAIGGAIILHTAVFAGAELFSTAERAPAVPEQISVVVTRVNLSPHGEGTAAPPTETQRERSADTEPPIIEETAAIPKTTPTAVPTKEAEHTFENQHEQPVDTEPAIIDKTPVRLPDTVAEQLIGPAPESGERESPQVVGSEIHATPFERAANESLGGASAADAAATPDEAIHPDRRYVKPRYPERARRAGVEGIVVVTFEIDQRGRPARIALQESSGSPLLDREAVRAVQLWRFSRADAGEVSVHRIEFRLQEDL